MFVSVLGCEARFAANVRALLSYNFFSGEQGPVILRGAYLKRELGRKSRNQTRRLFAKDTAQYQLAASHLKTGDNGFLRN